MDKASKETFRLLDKAMVRFTILFIGVLLFMFSPYFSSLDFDSSAKFGDTLSGLSAAFIGSLGVTFTFLAFWVQFQANQQQRKDIQVERFESKLYSLLEIHRNNVNETTIGKTTLGRKAFVSMFSELKFTFHAVEEYYIKSYQVRFPNDVIPEAIRYNTSYIIFFFGVGPNSSPIVLDLIGAQYHVFFTGVESYLMGYQRTWRTARSQGQTIAVPTANGIFELDLKYKPCNGHMSKLSHYIRHLYRLVKFVHDSQIFNYDEKYQYVSTIRSQLSSHEQLLVYYNALSVLGQPWLNEPNYLSEYCVIKSVPLPLADFYRHPQAVLGEINSHGQRIFEWAEIQERIQMV